MANNKKKDGVVWHTIKTILGLLWEILKTLFKYCIWFVGWLFTLIFTGTLFKKLFNKKQ